MYNSSAGEMMNRRPQPNFKSAHTISLALICACVLALLLAPLPAMAKSIILISMHDAPKRTDILVAMDPATGNSWPVYNFSGHPRHKSGLIMSPRVDASGQQIFFSSDNSFAYTPFRRNLFRITTDGRGWQQITPGVNSGRWDQPCPCGVVKGVVTRKNGQPYSSAPVFLEGVGMVHTKGDGSFEFPKVPGGARWIMAYRPGNTSAYDSQLISPAPGAPVVLRLIPDSTNRPSLQYPVPYKGQVFFMAGVHSLVRLNLADMSTTTVYQVRGSCLLTQISGYDIGPRTGRLAVVDYAEGCPTNRGVYVSKGNQMGLLVDAKKDQRWCGLGQVFWSPDESKLALTACLTSGGFQRAVYLMVVSAANGQVLGYWGMSNTAINLAKVKLHGWSPDGKHLLFSWHADKQANGNLAVIAVAKSGALDHGSVRQLMGNRYIQSATWANIVGPVMPGAPAKRPPQR